MVPAMALRSPLPPPRPGLTPVWFPPPSPQRSCPQYRHYQALLDIWKLKPSKESKEFGDLVMFLAQVGPGCGLWGGAGAEAEAVQGWRPWPLLSGRVAEV